MRADQYMFQTKHSGQLQPRQYSVKKIYIKEYSENGVAGDLTRELTLGDIKNQPAPSGARLKILQVQKEQGSRSYRNRRNKAREPKGQNEARLEIEQKQKNRTRRERANRPKWSRVSGPTSTNESRLREAQKEKLIGLRSVTR